MQIFKSKIDKWVLVCLALSTIACLMGASVMLKIGGTFNYALAAVVIIAGAGIPLWILVSTRYIVSEDELKIVSGPFSWIIAISVIKSVQETQSTITSPALSFDRLEIIYGEDKAIIVSPLDKAGFVKQLGQEKSIGTRRQVEGNASKRARKNKTNRKSAV